MGRNHDRGYPATAICEVGPVFESHKNNGQRLCAAEVRSLSFGPRHWSDKSTSRPVDAFDAKADVMAVLQACGGPSQVQITRDAPSWYHPGRSGVMRLGATVLARFGEIHPAILEDMKITGPVAGFEVFLDALPQPKKKAGDARPLLQLSDLQPISRDFAFIVDAGIEAEAVIRAARMAHKTLITAIEVFDVYQGKGVEPGKKSIAIAVSLQPQDKTLTDAEIDSLSKDIVNNVTAKTGAQLRS